MNFPLTHYRLIGYRSCSTAQSDLLSPYSCILRPSSLLSAPSPALRNARARLGASVVRPNHSSEALSRAEQRLQTQNANVCIYSHRHRLVPGKHQLALLVGKILARNKVVGRESDDLHRGEVIASRVEHQKGESAPDHAARYQSPREDSPCAARFGRDGPLCPCTNRARPPSSTSCTSSRWGSCLHAWEAGRGVSGLVRTLFNAERPETHIADPEACRPARWRSGIGCTCALRPCLRCAAFM